MPDRLQLLRSITGGNAPTGLLHGEPAVNLADHRLFIGGGAADGYPLGCQSMAYPRRLGAPRIVGDISATALTTFNTTSGQLYFIPFVVPRSVQLMGLGISVTTGSSRGQNVYLGIYGNAVVTGQDAPGELLASGPPAFARNPGNPVSHFSFGLEPGRLYWACLFPLGNPGIRALPAGAQQVALGRVAGSTSSVSYLYAAGSGSTLPDPAPTELVNASGNCPAIYLLE
jgi:hypothetical protein